MQKEELAYLLPTTTVTYSFYNVTTTTDQGNPKTAKTNGTILDTKSTSKYMSLDRREAFAGRWLKQRQTIGVWLWGIVYH